MSLAGWGAARVWEPHDYQRRAAAWLMERGSAILALDPGLGKTSITLEAFRRLKESGVARKMLVVAPLRVCQLVWRQEGALWEQFRGLTFSLVTGDALKRRRALAVEADVYLINPESVPWLVSEFSYGRRWPFDTVTLDELTRFKNHTAVRSKRLLPLMSKTARRWGLTGTLVPNGYEDLFGQMLMIDGGLALGRYKSHYLSLYFEQGWTGFDWTLRDGSEAKILARIANVVLRMSAADYLSLPPLINDLRLIDLEPSARQLYKTLKDELVAQHKGEELTAVNAGVLYGKLKQVANGAFYRPDGAHVVVHGQKLDALAELVDELNGEQLFVAYEFNHDLERMLERFPETPHLGGGVSAKRVMEIEEGWNAGRIPLLFAHPASVGHGLNFQRSGAAHICWFSVTTDLELYQQFIRRLHRQGTTAAHIINHILIVKGTVDEISLDTVDGKNITQAKLYEGLALAAKETDVSFNRLSRPAHPAPHTEEAPPERPLSRGWGQRPAAAPDVNTEAVNNGHAPAPQRWGAPAAPAPAADDDDDVEPAPERPVMSAFSDDVRARAQGEPNAAPAKVRKPRAKADPAEPAAPPQSAPVAVGRDDQGLREAAVFHLRTLLEAKALPPYTSVDALIEDATRVLGFLKGS